MPPHILSLGLAAPLVGAGVIALLRDGPPRRARTIATSASAASFLLAVLLWFGYEPAGVTWQFAERVPIVPALGFTYALGVDGFSVLLVLVATFVTTVAFVVPPAGLATPGLCARMLIFESAVLAVFTAIDLLLLSAAWAAAFGAAAWLLRAGHERVPTRRFDGHAAGSSIAFLAGTLALYLHVRAAAGVYTFDLARVLQLTIPPEAQTSLSAPFFVAFAVAVPLVPFTAWIGDAHEGPPGASRLLVAALLLKLGTYGVLRILLPVFPDASRTAAPLVTGLAGITMAVALAFALRQTDWRRGLAYASGAYVALSVFTAFRLTPSMLAAGMLQQVDHGLLAAGAFGAAGILQRRRAGTAANAAPLRARATVTAMCAAVVVAGGWSMLVATRTVASPAYGPIETAAGRVVARVHPAYAPVVRQPSDCGATRSTAPPSSAAPAGWVTSQPCEEPGAPVSKPGR